MQSDETHKQEPTRRRRRWWRWLVELALLVAIVVAVQGYQSREVARGEAPDFSAQLLDGRDVTLQAYRGRPLLLQFWATWCPVCRLEQGSIHALARDHQVLSVSIDDMSVPELQRWMADKGVSYPVTLDTDGRLSQLYGVRGVPTSIVIDKDGDIRFVAVGYTTEIGLRLRLWWAGH